MNRIKKHYCIFFRSLGKVPVLEKKNPEFNQFME